MAISPELPDNSLTTKEKHELPFPVLSDPDNRVAHQFRIVYTLPDPLKTSYSNFFSLSEYYGNEKGELPLPVTYIIDTNYVIRYAYLDADYRKRAEPAEVIEALHMLSEE
ncbi:MAG: hypothetical protein Kow0074_17100 [Candidatus Zixiibacteriota bacterium]